MAKDRFTTLPPLPGGSDQVVGTLAEMLRFVQHKEMRTREEFTDWVVLKYGGARSSVTVYLQTLVRLGLFERRQRQLFALTADGEAFLQTGDLHTQTNIVLPRLLRSYVGLLDMLLWLSKSDSPVSMEEMVEQLGIEFPAWATGDAISRRLYWLLGLGCIRQANRKRVYEITTFARRAIEQFRMIADDADRTRINPLDSHLITRMRQAARDTQQPVLFEQIIGEVFTYLGYRVTHRGGIGETDLVVQALLGQSSYIFIVDAKTRHDGRLHELDVLTIRSHAQAANADFAVVVAESFSGEKIRWHALDNNITLLPVSVLAEWITLHQQTPLNLANYRSINIPGIMTALPEAITAQSGAQLRRFALIERLIDLFNHAYAIDLDIRWSSSQLHSNLAMQYPHERYSQQDVDEAVGFLSNPLIGGIIPISGELVLGINHATLAQLLHSFAETL